MTKESCGAFNEALEDGILEPAYAQPYQFCDKSDQRIDSHYMERCQTCVGLDESQSYLVNCEKPPDLLGRPLVPCTQLTCDSPCGNPGRMQAETRPWRRHRPQ